MDKNYLSESAMGKITFIKCEDSQIIVVTSILNEIAKYTDNREEAIDLYAYLYGRMQRYNETLKTNDDQETPKGSLTPIMIQGILVSLLQTKTYDFIINILDDVKDYDLFSASSMLEGVSTEDVIDYVVAVIKDNYEMGHSIEEDYFDIRDFDTHNEEYYGEDGEGNPKDCDEDPISYEDKVKAAIIMELPTIDDEEAKQLGLTPIGQ